MGAAPAAGAPTCSLLSPDALAYAEAASTHCRGAKWCRLTPGSCGACERPNLLPASFLAGRPLRFPSRPSPQPLPPGCTGTYPGRSCRASRHSIHSAPVPRPSEYWARALRGRCTRPPAARARRTSARGEGQSWSHLGAGSPRARRGRHDDHSWRRYQGNRARHDDLRQPQRRTSVGMRHRSRSVCRYMATDLPAAATDEPLRLRPSTRRSEP
jgi:hypothetical protein